MDIWIVSSWEFRNTASEMYLLKNTFSFLWGIYPRVVVLVSRVCLFSSLVETVKLFCYVLNTNLYLYQNCMRLLIVILPLQSFILFIFFYFSHCFGCLVMFSCGFAFSLVTVKFSTFSSVHWPFVHFLCEVRIPSLAHFPLG